MTLAANNSLAITNSFYSGADTNGALVSQFGGVASGANYLTDTFDALAVGWRETGSQATAIDINNIAVNSTLTVEQTNQISRVSTNIAFQVAGNVLQLSWPQDHIGWNLQMQVDDLNQGLGTNWVTVADSNITNQMSFSINATNGCTFFRLWLPD